MAKKKNIFGKLLAFTTTTIAIGGICYLFRDKIKQSSIYKTISGKFSDFSGHFFNEFCDSDNENFFFDDEDDDFEDAFSKDAEHGREYTSITINAKNDSKKEDETTKEQNTKSNFDSIKENFPKNDDMSPSQKDSPKNDNAASFDENSIKNDNADLTEDNPVNEDNKSESDEIFSNEDLIEIFPKDSITNIKVGNTSDSGDSVPKKNISSAGIDSYENEGLSDVSEDPDTLESQDKLDI